MLNPLPRGNSLLLYFLFRVDGLACLKLNLYIHIYHGFFSIKIFLYQTYYKDHNIQHTLHTTSNGTNSDMMFIRNEDMLNGVQYISIRGNRYWLFYSQLSIFWTAGYVKCLKSQDDSHYVVCLTTQCLLVFVANPLYFNLRLLCVILTSICLR